MEGNTTFLDPPEPGGSQAQALSGRSTEKKTMTFSFDKSYWSAGPRDEPRYCSQQTLYNDLGKELLDHGFAGFNACILACTSYQSSCPLRAVLTTRCDRWTNGCVVIDMMIEGRADVVLPVLKVLGNHIGTSSNILGHGVRLLSIILV